MMCEVTPELVDDGEMACYGERVSCGLIILRTSPYKKEVMPMERVQLCRHGQVARRQDFPFMLSHQRHDVDLLTNRSIGNFQHCKRLHMDL